jgi:holliday junction DNA helicase RuvB
MAGISQQVIASCTQLLGHAVKLRRAGPPPPPLDDAGHRAALAAADRTLAEHPASISSSSSSKPALPPRLFDPVEGHEPAKRLLRRALLAPAPVHVLLVGPPGSGKTQLLQRIATLPNSRYATGPTISSSGLFTYLLDHPATRQLVIDELDKAAEPDLYMLLTLMESGKITRLQHRAIEEESRIVWVFAAANSDADFPAPLRDRFVRIPFAPYSEAEARAIIERVLVKREGVTPARARAIAAAVAARSRDPRDAVQVARLAPGGVDFEPVLEQVIPSKV